MFGLPRGPQHRTRPAKLEIPFGNAFDSAGCRRPRAQRAGVPSLRSAIEERAVFGMPGGVARHKGALRDHSFPVASQRFENAMRQSRSVSQAQRFHSVKHVAVDHWTGIPAYASDERRLAIPGNVRVWLAPGHTDMRGLPGSRAFGSGKLEA